MDYIIHDLIARQNNNNGGINLNIKHSQGKIACVHLITCMDLLTQVKKKDKKNSDLTYNLCLFNIFLQYFRQYMKKIITIQFNRTHLLYRLLRKLHPLRGESL